MAALFHHRLLRLLIMGLIVLLPSTAAAMASDHLITNYLRSLASASANVSLWVSLSVGLVVAVFVGGMASVLLSSKSMDTSLLKQQEILAGRQLALIRDQIVTYAQRKGDLPSDLTQAGISSSLLRNPWGRPYVYRIVSGQAVVTTEMPEKLCDAEALDDIWLQAPESLNFICHN